MHHSQHVGEDTRDLTVLREQHPVENGLPHSHTERALIRWSGRALAAGLAILIGAYGTTLVAALLVSAHGAINRHAALFSMLGLVALTQLGAGLLVFHGFERVTRQTRTLTRRTSAQTVGNAAIGAGIATAVDDLGALVARLAVQLDHGTAEIEALREAMKKVAGYGKGVTDGFTIARAGAGLDDLDRVSQGDPDEMRRWGIG
jgi:hypothetical protein